MKYEIEEEVLQAVMNYLGTCIYNQTAVLIGALKQCKAIKDEPCTKKDSTK